jgi:anti-sigma regulatory factor (Ser/Thr protein kinase)
VLEGGSPAEVLDRVNRFLLSLDIDTMATMVVCLVEPATGTVCYANAGHCLPLVRAGAGKVSYIDNVGGVPLGALDSPQYQDAATTFDAGDTLVLYTDGLVEERGQDYATGLQHLEDAAAAGEEDPERLCSRILEKTVGSGVRDDDVTLLVLRVLERLDDDLDLDVIGDQDALHSMRAMLRRWLREATQDEEVVADVTMAVNEAVQNAIEHAHGLDRTKVQVEMRRDNGAVRVAVRDHGRWRTDRDHSEERGRGLDLMRALMDGVDIDPRPSGSTVTLSHRLKNRR